jgi:SepF-like predicted cell division protein (DUF552 family)
MKEFLSGIKKKFRTPQYDDIEQQDYVEIESSHDEALSRVLVRPFMLEEFEDVKPILNVLREGRTIALLNIKPLKDKDIVELKRAINKLKKTCDAIEGEIAGFGEDYIVVTPAFASIYRGPTLHNVEH